MNEQERQNHQLYLDFIRNYADTKSKCQYTKVACLALNESDRIIATGVNGTVSGMPNCCDCDIPRDSHKDWSDANELHAEENLILELATSSVTFKELKIYITISPCEPCLKKLLGLNKKEKGCSVKEIIFADRYHRTSKEDLQRMIEYSSKVGTKLVWFNES